jgi:hypothetical protein
MRSPSGIRGAVARRRYSLDLRSVAAAGSRYAPRDPQHRSLPAVGMTWRNWAATNTVETSGTNRRARVTFCPRTWGTTRAMRPMFMKNRWLSWGPCLRSEPDWRQPTCGFEGGSRLHPRRRAGDGLATGQVRVTTDNQACAPLGSMVMSRTAASIVSTRHPSAKLVRISSRVTRRGPQSPGWRSLKHNMK